MSSTAILLIILSAVLHATWNFISKKYSPTAAFLLCAIIFGTFPVYPLSWYYWRELIAILPGVWKLALLTGLFQALYFCSLAGAYRNGDISLSYPLVRSLPLLMIAGISPWVGRGGDISINCIVGIVAILIGSVVLPMTKLGEARPRDYFNRASLFILLAAVGTAGYSLVDDYAFFMVRERGYSPLMAVFLFLVFEIITTAFFMGIFVVMKKDERRAFIEIVKTSKVKACMAGTATYLAYGLVLVATAFVANVSYVAALRQLSIPLGAFAGILLLGEACNRPRVIGIATITTGLILVGLG